MKQKRNYKRPGRIAFEKQGRIRIPMRYLFDFAARVIKGNPRCRRLIAEFNQLHGLGESSHDLMDILSSFVVMTERQRAWITDDFRDDPFLSDVCRLSNQIVERLSV